MSFTTMTQAHDNDIGKLTKITKVLRSTEVSLNWKFENMTEGQTDQYELWEIKQFYSPVFHNCCNILVVLLLDIQFDIRLPL